MPSFNQVSTPASTISLGDEVSIVADFDTNDAQVTGLYNADPSITIYYGSIYNLTYQIGGFNLAVSPAYKSFASFQLWDNHLVGSRTVDYFGISTLTNLNQQASPIDLGIGAVTAHFNLNAFNNSGAARSSDSIVEEPVLSSYESVSAGIGFLNTATYLQTVMSINGLTASLMQVEAVPESSSWAMMVGGFGLMGAAMRRRRKVAITYA